MLLLEWSAFMERPCSAAGATRKRVDPSAIPYFWRLVMKKLLALVCVLAVGLLVGCGSEKPKAKAPPAIDAMKDMSKAAAEAAAAGEKAVEKAGEAVEKAGAAVEKAAEDATKKATEGAEKAL